jgi:hypothetical protein
MPKGAEGHWEHAGWHVVGECLQGCCDRYKCRDCGKELLCEVPQ